MPIASQGWAFVSGSNPAGGTSGSIQYNRDGELTGSTGLVWEEGEEDTVLITGSLSASSTITALNFSGNGSGLTHVTASAVAVADGPEMSLQFRYDSPIGREISGSSDLMWITGSSDDFLQVTGAVKIAGPHTTAPRFCVTGAVGVLASSGGGLHISGSASGSLLDITSDAVGSATKSILFVSGSGDIGIGTLLPNHTLTISGSVSASSDISASAFHGDGSPLTGVPDISGTPVNTQVALWTDADTLEGDPRLTYGENEEGIRYLAITGAVSASLNISASSFYANGDLSVCAGTASIAHLSGCSDINVYSPLLLSGSTAIRFKDENQYIEGDADGNTLTMAAPGDLNFKSGGDQISWKDASG